MRTLAPLALLLGLAASVHGPGTDETAVRATLQHYLDGHATGRGDVMARAFDSVANLYWVADGQLRTRTVEDYVGGFSGRPAADEAQRRRRITHVDVTGTAAVARIELDYPNARFTDYMALLRIDGEWRIVAKLFHRDAPQAPAAAGIPSADPADVATPEAIVAALYATVQRAPGAGFAFDRMRTLFLPGALLVPNPEQTGGQGRVLGVEDFIAWIEGATVVGGPDDRGFAEEEVHHVIERYGDIAHVFSTYEKHYHGDSRVLGRGINSIQLLFRDGRWWVTSIIWDEETGAGPIPDRYQ